MNSVTLTFKIIIESNQKIIFNYLSDWEKQSDWILFTTVSKMSSPADQKGTKLLATTSFGPLKLIDSMVVIDWRPPKRIVVEHTGKVVQGKGIFKIKELSEEQCEFTWEEITPIPFGFIGKIGFIIVRPLMNLMFGLSLRKLKRNIENVAITA